MVCPLRSIVFLAGAFLAMVAPRGAAQTSPPITAILGAQTREIALLREELTGRKEHRILGIPYWEGELAGRRAVIARMASGKVNAAMVATLAIEHFRPSEVIVTGIAGGLNPDLGPGDIVIARKTVQHDLVLVRATDVEYRGARNPIRGGRIPVFLEPPPELLKTAERAAQQTRFIPIRLRDDGATTPSPHQVRVIIGIVATGDAFVASDARRTELRDDLEADAVEMEGAAVGQVCYHLDVPCLVIRCMSDMADNTAVEDLVSFADVAATNSAHLVREILRLLAGRKETPSP